MKKVVLSAAARRLLGSFQQDYSTHIVRTNNLQMAFIKTRFDYIRAYCEAVSGEFYTAQTLPSMANVLVGFRSNPPGTELDPWADFDGRHETLEESDYLVRLFSEPRTGLTPRELFAQRFNAYLVTHRVPVVLKVDYYQLRWVLA